MTVKFFDIFLSYSTA